jgi:hypothetical protein
MCRMQDKEEHVACAGCKIRRNTLCVQDAGKGGTDCMCRMQDKEEHIACA